MLEEQTDPYTWWNSELASHFFSPAATGQSVSLFVTRELIEQIGIKRRVGKSDFIEAVNDGPKWSPRGRLCEKALAVYEHWRRRNLNFPPYIGYLSLFVLAAGLEGDYAPNAYYPRLRTLLGQKPETGTYPGYCDMHRLWEDLEQWSNVDKQGELGIFTARIAGSRAHVGLPIAQIILSEREREALPSIFADSYLDPGLAYSDTELALALRQHANGRLGAATLAILSPHNRETDRFDVLLDTVREELARWDGSVRELSSSNGKVAINVNGGLRLGLSVDRTAGRVNVNLHCHLNRDYPEDGLNLVGTSLGHLVCEEYLDGWSTPLVSLTSGQEISVSNLRWDKEIDLREDKLGWKFRLPPRDVRIFAPGATVGLAGYIEVNQLANLKGFLITAAPAQADKVRMWGEKSCDQLVEISIESGLPLGWRLFSGRNPRSDVGIREIAPTLAFSSTVRIALQNGIRIGKGNVFFDFGLPNIAIEGGNGQEQVFCNDCQLSASTDTGLYSLPENLALNSRITVEVRRGGETLRRESLYVQAGGPWQQMNAIQVFNKFSRPAVSSQVSEGFAGSWCGHRTDEVAPYLYPIGIGRSETYYIGPEAGQIVKWPEEQLPTSWSPVWAVIVRQRRGKVVYCGTNLTPPSMTRNKAAPRRKIRDWQELLWHSRKRIAYPALPSLRGLWQQYVKAAKNAR